MSLISSMFVFLLLHANCHMVLLCLVFSSFQMFHLRTWVVLYSHHNPLQSGGLDGPRRHRSRSQSWVFMPFTKWIVSPSSQDEHQVLEMPPLQMHPGALSSVMSHHPDMLQSNHFPRMMGARTMCAHRVTKSSRHDFLREEDVEYVLPGCAGHRLLMCLWCVMNLCVSN